MSPRRLSRAVAGALAITALAAPAAQALPQELISGPSPAGAPQSQPVIRTVDEGFDWGAAGVGAGIGAAAVLVSLGAVVRVHPRTAR
jgi:hypothetical protein